MLTAGVCLNVNHCFIIIVMLVLTLPSRADSRWEQIHDSKCSPALQFDTTPSGSLKKKCGEKKRVEKKSKKERRLATCILANHIQHQLLMSANCCQFHVNRTGTSIFAPANVSHYDKLNSSTILHALICSCVTM